METSRTELIWPGKNDEDVDPLAKGSRLSLPFQVIETVNESRVSREVRKSAAPTLFDLYEGTEGDSWEEGWRNKLIWGENKIVLTSLLERFSGRVDLIYIDPPFATGADFSFLVPVGEGDASITKQQSVIEEKAYRDTWGKGLASYLSMMADRVRLLRELLSPRGTLYLHVDHRVLAHVKLVCDETFGAERFLNLISWRRQIPRGMKTHARYMPFSTDYILMYGKGEEATWNAPRKEVLISLEEAERKYMKDERGFFRTSDPGTYSDESLIRLHKEGRIHVTKGGELVVKDGKVSVTRGSIGVKYYREQRGNKVVEETTVDNLWDDVPGLGIVSSEYLGYPTQKPASLLRRIIEASSNPGDLVGDFFCGSGTSLLVAEKYNRRWIGCDLGRFAIHTTRKRLLGVEKCKPFEILNLGKYERKYWQVATFGDDLDRDGSIALWEYVAFILRLYGASPVAGMQYLHGKKGPALIHVGPVDSPVTLDEVQECINECLALKQKELHVLGWEWEMGINDLAVDSGKAQGVRLALLQIPREVMEQRDSQAVGLQFFELAYVDAAIKETRARTFSVILQDFILPNPELVPAEVNEKIEKWSDHIDYWAVDWDFRSDTFMQGWVAYRTRKDRQLVLESDEHIYEEPGIYKVLIKVIDIFGNDTSKTLEVSVT